MKDQAFLQVLGADATRLLHAIRFDNASWTTVGDVEGQAGNPSPIQSVACASAGGDLHVFVATSHSIFRTRRYGGGTWTPFEDLGAALGARWRGVQHIACASYFGEIYLCAIDAKGALIHSLFSSGQWGPLEDVAALAGGPSIYTHLACNAYGNVLHVFGAPANLKGLRHTVRDNRGHWVPMEELIQFAPEPVEYIMRVASATVLGDVHVVASDLTGPLWHLSFDGTTQQWSNFVDIKTKIGNPGIVGYIAAANCADELHVTLSTNDAQNWRHTIRHENDAWQPFGDVWLATLGSEQQRLSTLAVAGTESWDSPARPATPGFAFEFDVCLPETQTTSLTQRIDAAAQKIATSNGVVAGLLGNAQSDLACVGNHERGGIFLYSESDRAMNAGVPLIDLLSRTNQNPEPDFAVLFSHGALEAAIGGVWDTFRGDDGIITLPTNHDIHLTSYSIDYPSPQQLRLNVTGMYMPLSATFTAHYVDTFFVYPDGAPPDGLPGEPHMLVSSTSASSLDLDPVFYLAMVFVVPGIINAILGGIGAARGAPTLQLSLGQVVSQLFLPKIYLAGGKKVVMQYAGVLADASYGVEAYGTVEERQRAPTLDVTAWPDFPPFGKGGIPRHVRARHVTAMVTSDDMQNPKFSFAAVGMSLTSQTDPAQSPDGTQFTVTATFRVGGLATSAELTVTATDQENNMSATTSVRVSLVSY